MYGRYSRNARKLAGFVLGLCFAMYVWGSITFRELNYLLFSTQASGKITSIEKKPHRSREVVFGFVDLRGDFREGTEHTFANLQVGEEVRIQYFPHLADSARIAKLAPVMEVFLFLGSCLCCFAYMWKPARELLSALVKNSFEVSK